MGVFRIGLVGVGRGSGYGRVFAHDPRCEIVACCDAKDESLARFQQELALPDDACFTRYDDFVARDLDIVFLGTPIPFHADEAVAALETGKHVLSEVTAASTVEDCARIFDTVLRTGQRYMLAENCCYWPFVAQWRDWVQAGRIGEVFYGECEYVHDIRSLVYDPVTQTQRWRANRAPLHYCSHSLGPILEVMGDRIIRAMGAGESRRLLPEGGVGGVDIQVALFETRQGAIIKLLRSSVAPRKPAIHYYTLQGTKGYVESSRRGIPGPGMLYCEGEMDGPEEIEVATVDTSLPEEARAGGHGTAEYALVQDFLGALQAGRKPPLDESRAMD
ncbi:MAG: Gfo/Idh/MocA family oxidoreductase, partial [Armatimonadetes bacterium]|nr:Gfo/Idh/MocA family oxidoreductase [Armatimonadota bacterium]